jgi:hypothetical protein
VRNIPPPSSGYNSKPRRKPALLAVYFVLYYWLSYFSTLKKERYVSPERHGMFTGVHGVVSQKVEGSLHGHSCEKLKPRSKY